MADERKRRNPPVVDLPLDVAASELTGFEVLGIEKRFTKLEEMGGTQMLIGCVWAYENRRDKRSWQSVEALTMRELQEYFADSPDDVLVDDPDSDMGKESEAVSEQTSRSPNGASAPASVPTSITA